MISEDRYKHIIAVARLMKEECVKNKKSKEYAEEMFTLGLLHDIGYEFGGHAEHSQVGFAILDRQGYKYANEIRFHGDDNCDYASKELDLLNFADMHTNEKGEYVTFEERLQDIADRRGVNSDAYKSAKNIINGLLQKGYK